MCQTVRSQLEELKAGLPDGVEIVTTYDRSSLIERAVETLQEKLVEEFIVVTLVCALFLFHLRSSLVVILSLPVGILFAFIIMHAQGFEDFRQRGQSLKGMLSEIEQDLIERALRESDGNVSRCAKLLRMQRTTLIERIKKYNLKMDAA